MMSGNVQYSLPDGEMSLHISDALVANSAGNDLAPPHIKDDPAIKLGRSNDYHLKTRSKTSVFNCDVCERTFESAEFLSSHVLSHSLDIGAYSCEICHKVFAEKYDLVQHKCLQNADMHSQNLMQNANTFHPQTDVPRSDLNGPYSCVSGMSGNDGGSGSHSMDEDYSLGLNSQQKGVPFFTCEYCEKKFKTNSALLIHRRSHTGETPFPCEFCGKSFRQSAHLDVHMRIHTGEMPYKCAYCDKSFTQKNNRNRHQLLHLNPNGQESGNEPDVQTKPHVENCMNGPPIGNMPAEPPQQLMNSYENAPITPTTQVGANYSQPMQIPGSSQFTYQCNICHKIYSNNPALQQHMQSHNKEHSFDCYVCGHKFKQRAHLETHLRVHTHEMPYKCQYCDKCFSQKGNKNRHERLHLLNNTAEPSSGTLPPSSASNHSNSTSLSSTSIAMETTMNSAKSCIQQPNIYIDSEFASCDICHKQFFNKDDLNAHRNSHLSLPGNTPPMDNTMNNMESSHQQLTTGQYGQTYCNISSDKSYQMRDSPQVTFSTSKVLAVDQNTVSPANSMGNKMYYAGGNGGMPEPMRQNDPNCCSINTSTLSPCEVCGKEISCQQEMLQHAQCQKGVFTCEYCHKEFGSNSSLQVHRRVHTGETPYKCDFCDKGFKQAPHLDVHLRTHTGEMPYQCLYCDKKFTQNSNKNRHQRSHFLGEGASGIQSPNSMNPGSMNAPENNENPFTTNLKCELCGCVFTDRNGFVNHMLSHQSSSGNYGSMPDNSKHSTLTHGLTHLYQCNACSANFSCQASLDSHIAMVHNSNHKNSVIPNNSDNMQFGQQKPMMELNSMKHGQSRPMEYANMPPHSGAPSEMTSSGPVGNNSNYVHHQNTNFYPMNSNGMSGGVGVSSGTGVNGGGGGVSCTNNGDGSTNDNEAQSSGHEAYGGYCSNREPVVNMNCEFCQKNFKSVSSLTIHRRVHTGETPFQCTFCSRAFKQNAHLEVHMRTHTGETPFKCEFCDKRFTQKSNRDRHQRTHFVDAVSLQNSDINFPVENADGKETGSEDRNTEAEGYKCDLCSSVFTDHEDYTDHRSCHDIPRLSEDSRRPHNNKRKYDSTDSNPNESRGGTGGEGGVFKCDLCGSYFSNVSDLRYHQDSHHSQEMYPSGDNLGNSSNPNRSQYLNNADAYNYQPEPKRYCSERGYSHHGSGYQDGGMPPMSGPMPSSDVSYQERNESGYMRPEESSYCEMGGNYCSAQNNTAPPPMPPHHGNSTSSSQIGDVDEHMCNFCPGTFRSTSALSVHRRTHTSAGESQCDCCQRCFGQNAHLDVHPRTNTREIQCKCEYCDKRYAQTCNRDQHNHHVDVHNKSNVSGGGGGGDQYRCDVCPSEFTNQDDFNDHRSCHDIPKIYETTPKPSSPVRRGRRRGPVKSYVEIDDDLFDNDDDMPVSESYGCNQCDEKCHSNNRPRHMSPNVRNDQSCFQHQAATAYRDNQKYSSYRSDSHQCEICSQKFFGEEELCQHRLTHMNNPYSGEIGGSYTQHQTPTSKHSDVPMLDAKKDGGNYSNANHKMTGNKCEVCHKAFSSTSALLTHMRVHTGEAPYKCEFCHRAFKQTAHLEVHMRVHTGETPFKCQFCDKRFTQKNNMIRHEKIHHGDVINQGGGTNTMPVDSNVDSMDSPCQTCEAQCRGPLSNNRTECPGITDSVSDCDICCKESRVKLDVCPYSKPNHCNTSHPNKTDNPQDVNGTHSNFDEKSVLPPKKMQLQKYDCCQEACIDTPLNPPDRKHYKSSKFPLPTEKSPVENLALQLPYACRHCKIEFLNQADLCDHEPQCGAANFVTPGASGKFPTMTPAEGESVYLDGNQVETTGNQCEFCQKVFKNFSSLSVHRRVHTGEAPFQCQVCQRRFKQNSHLENHMRTHTDEAPYKCEFCDKCFTQAGNRNRHQRTHFMDAISLGATEFNRLHQDDENNEADSSEVVENQETDSGIKIPNMIDNSATVNDADDGGDDDVGPDKNDNVDNAGGRREEKEEVNKPVHNQRRKRGRPKGSRSYFKIERQPSPECIKTEVAEDLLMNDLGDRRQTRSLSRLTRNINRNMIVADDVGNRFTCDVCNLSFTNTDALTHHQKSVNHVAVADKSSNNKTDTFPLICEYCDKTFTNASGLSVHRRVHTGETPFRCPYCHKSFKQNAHLDVHMRTHTGETPFQCAFCDKRFTQNCNRLRHQKTHFTNVTSGQEGAAIFNSDPNSDTAAYGCGICHQGFDTKHNFDSHVCIDHSYVADDDGSGDVQSLLPSPDNDPQLSSGDKIKSIDEKKELPGSRDDGFEKASDNPPADMASYSDFPIPNKRIKEEETSPQKDFSEIETDPVKFQSAEDREENSREENRANTDEMTPSEKKEPTDSKYGDFACGFCPRTFRSQSALLAHRRIHTGETPYQCPYCSKSFKQVAHLDTHLRVHTGEKPYLCKYCPKSFTQKSNRNRHEQVHELSGKTRPVKGSVPEHRCELCDGYFADATDLDMHRCTMTATDDWSNHAGSTDISADGQNLPYTCNICDKEYRSRVRYEKHRQTHEQKDEAMAPLMERNGQSGTSSSDEHTFFCEVCQQKFTDKTEYTDHIFMHISENPYQQNPETHKNTKPIEEIHEVCYLCEQCQNEFYSRNDFYNHRCFKNTINGKNRFNSENAENIDNSSAYNNEHFGSSASNSGQSEDLPVSESGLYNKSFFECDFCDKTFKNHSTMLIHRRVHTGEMPFKCKFCERCFKQNAHLEVHLRTHTGETPFHCRFCERSFTQKGNRNRHERTHLMNSETGEGQPDDGAGVTSFEENLRCHLCAVDFSTEDDLKEHLLTHTDDEMETEFQPMGSYLTTLKEEHEMYEREALSNNSYPSSLGDGSLPYAKNTSMMYVNNVEPQLQDENGYPDGSKVDASGQFYECEFCHKQLKSLSSLVVHRRVHTGETPYKCQRCERSFKQLAHLDVHMRTHTGETPYKCEFCDKSFTQNSNRLRHQRLHFMDTTSIVDDDDGDGDGVTPPVTELLNDNGTKDQVEDTSNITSHISL